MPFFLILKMNIYFIFHNIPIYQCANDFGSYPCKDTFFVCFEKVR